jgi:hypothetical protein
MHLGHTDPDCAWDGKANQRRACCKDLIQPWGKAQPVIAFTLGAASQAPPCQFFLANTMHNQNIIGIKGESCRKKTGPPLRARTPDTGEFASVSKPGEPIAVSVTTA